MKTDSDNLKQTEKTPKLENEMHQQEGDNFE